MAETLRIVIEGRDKASRAFRSLLGSLQRVGEYAMGQLVARAIPALTRGLASLGKMAIGQVGAAQQLEMALGGLLTQSLMYEKVNKVRTATLRLTDKEQLQLQGLRANLDGLNVRLDKARYNYGEYLAVQGEAGIDTRKFAADVAKLETNIAKTTLAITILEGKEGKLVSTTEQVWEETMSFADAQAEAAKQVKELTKFIDLLSIESPFKRQQVEMVTKYSLQAAMGTERTKEFTGAFLDFAAAQGISSENLGFAAEQFMQLRKLGKLTTIDLRQLRRLGIDVSRILGIKMGMSVEEFNTQVAKSPELMDELFESFIELASETTADAARQMSLTLPGMMANLQDIMEVGSRDLFRPMIEAVSPALLGLLEKLKGFVLGPGLKEWAQKLADSAVRVVDFIKNWDIIWATFKASIAEKIGELKRTFEAEGFVAAIEKALSFVGIEVDFDVMFRNLLQDLRTAWDRFWLGQDVTEEVPPFQPLHIPGMKEQIIGIFDELSTVFEEEGLVATIEKALSFAGVEVDFSALGQKILAAWNEFWLGPEMQFLGDPRHTRMGGMRDKLIGALTKLATQTLPELQVELRKIFSSIGEQIPGWIEEGLLTAGEWLMFITARGEEWAESPETQEKLRGIGSAIGTAIHEAVASLLGDEQKAGGIMELFAFQLGAAASNIREMFVAMGQGFARGLIEGLTGWLISDQAMRKVRETMGKMQLPLLPPGQPPSPTGLSRFQGGTPFSPGGWSLLGERGPELVRLPAGSRVYNARESRGMGGDTYNITINAGDAPAYAIEGAARRGILSARRKRGLR